MKAWRKKKITERQEEREKARKAMAAQVIFRHIRMAKKLGNKMAVTLWEHQLNRELGMTIASRVVLPNETYRY